MDWIAREAALTDAMAPLFPDALGAGFTDAATDYGAPLRWTPEARAYAERVTAQVAQDIATMTATQRDRIQALVGAYSGDRAALVKALQSQDAYIAEHAALIAEDQVNRAYNHGAIAAAYAAGAQYVDVRDGTQDAECAAVNGTRQSLEWAAANPVAHPRCIRSFSIAREAE